MSSAQAWQGKRLLNGSHESGAFRDFYDNPDPNIQRQKGKEYMAVTEACDERKYTVRVDCGKVIDCFSNNLHLENSAASLPPVEIQTAISEVEAEGIHAEQATIINQGNEAATSDKVEE